MQVATWVFFLLCLSSFSDGAFICKTDGHFADDNDCTKYYHCANGRPNAGFCPNGLFWNKATNQCDWPEVTDCDFSLEKAREIRIENPTQVFLTFDDGPGNGTAEVLDALKAHGVRATFFINGHNLDRAENANALLRIVDEGHVLADHSYDHMLHNTGGVFSPKNAYESLENDIGYFGEGNAAPVLRILHMAGRDQATVDRVNRTMNRYVRMPYTNNWRVRSRGDEGGRLAIKADCPECTVPIKSGKVAMKLADVLSKERGVEVIGWDIEWSMNFASNRITYGGLQMFMRLGAGGNSKTNGKTVVLSHDAAFRKHEITGGSADQEELVTFLDLATNAGHKFKTVDEYQNDF